MLYPKIQKYSQALREHTWPLIRLSKDYFKTRFFDQMDTSKFHSRCQEVYGYETVSNKSNSTLTLRKETLKAMDPLAIYLQFFPLPTSLEKKIYGNSLLHAHHLTRVQLVRKFLPEAQNILDLGGADAQEQCGALLAMGYPHHPQSIHIVDLPVHQRIYDPSLIPETKDHIHGSCKVSYSYHAMHKLEHLKEKNFDLVWMGQTIEHITPKELDLVLKQLLQCLKPGAKFCLDTPNRILTKKLSPKSYIHPDHKIEYEPQQLIEIIRQYGFKLQNQKAINPLPESLKGQWLDRLEFLHGHPFSNKAEEGFSFYLEFSRSE